MGKKRQQKKDKIKNKEFGRSLILDELNTNLAEIVLEMKNILQKLDDMENNEKK